MSARVQTDDLSLFGRAAVRWVEVLLSRGETDTARWWLSEIERGIDDEGTLTMLCLRTGESYDDMWEAFRSTVFRNGKRVIVPSDPCLRFWDKKRSCTLAAGHDGDCEPRDVHIDTQYENLRGFEREYGAVVAAVAGGAR